MRFQITVALVVASLGGCGEDPSGVADSREYSLMYVDGSTLPAELGAGTLYSGILELLDDHRYEIAFYWQTSSGEPQDSVHRGRYRASDASLILEDVQGEDLELARLPDGGLRGVDARGRLLVYWPAIEPY